jgi:hypothetical protein
MKKIILLTSVSLFLTGCGQTDLEACYERVEKIAENHPMGPEMGKIGSEIAKGECNRKYGSKKNKTEERPFGVSSEEEKTLNKINPSTNGYSTQGEDVFWKGKKISGAFAESFEDLGNNYGKDENFTYFCGKRMEQEIKSLDFSTLEFPEGWNGYGKDSKALYYRNNKCKSPRLLETIANIEDGNYTKGKYALVSKWDNAYGNNSCTQGLGFNNNIKSARILKGGEYDRNYYLMFFSKPWEKIKDDFKKYAYCSKDTIYMVKVGEWLENVEKYEELEKFKKEFTEHKYLGSGYMKSSSTIYYKGESLWKSLSKAPSIEELNSFTVLKDGMAKSKKALWENGKLIKTIEEN